MENFLHASITLMRPRVGGRGAAIRLSLTALRGTVENSQARAFSTVALYRNGNGSADCDKTQHSRHFGFCRVLRRERRVRRSRSRPAIHRSQVASPCRSPRPGRITRSPADAAEAFAHRDENCELAAVGSRAQYPHRLLRRRHYGRNRRHGRSDATTVRFECTSTVSPGSVVSPVTHAMRPAARSSATTVQTRHLPTGIVGL